MKQYMKTVKEKREKHGLMVLAEKSLEKIWKNKKEDKIWSKYLLNKYIPKVYKNSPLLDRKVYK